jgi:hypothetical protein
MARKPRPPARRRPGRPIDESLPRARMTLRADETELAAWTAAAGRLGMPLAAWIRMACNAAARGGK